MRASIILSMALALTTQAWAEPSTRVAWTPETLRFVKNGDAAKGKELAGTCAGCHNEVSANPHLNGQLPTYLYRQLQDYKHGSRKDPSTAMNGVAGTLSDRDMADLAAYYGGQEPTKGAGGADDPTGIVARGDGRRMEPACSSCHGGSGQGEPVDTPSLAGQKAAYLEQVLLAYKSGERHNDLYGRMRLIAGKLSDREIKQLAEYYGKLK